MFKTMSKTIKKEVGSNIPRTRPKASKVKVRKRAYEIYLNRKGRHGSPDDDWRKAEEELMSEPGY
jgi:hypothetical protein